MYNDALRNNLRHDVAQERCSMKNQCQIQDVYVAEDNVLGSYECDSTPHQQPRRCRYKNIWLNGSMDVAVNTTWLSFQLSTDGNEKSNNPTPLSVESLGGDGTSVPSSRHEYQEDEEIDNSAKDNYHSKDNYQDKGNYHAFIS